MWSLICVQKRARLLISEVALQNTPCGLHNFQLAHAAPCITHKMWRHSFTLPLRVSTHLSICPSHKEVTHYYHTWPLISAFGSHSCPEQPSLPHSSLTISPLTCAPLGPIAPWVACWRAVAREANAGLLAAAICGQKRRVGWGWPWARRP